MYASQVIVLGVTSVLNYIDFRKDSEVTFVWTLLIFFIALVYTFLTAVLVRYIKRAQSGSNEGKLLVNFIAAISMITFCLGSMAFLLVVPIFYTIVFLSATESLTGVFVSLLMGAHYAIEVVGAPILLLLLVRIYKRALKAREISTEQASPTQGPQDLSAS